MGVKKSAGTHHHMHLKFLALCSSLVTAYERVKIREERESGLIVLLHLLTMLTTAMRKRNWGDGQSNILKLDRQICCVYLETFKRF